MQNLKDNFYHFLSVIFFIITLVFYNLPAFAKAPPAGTESSGISTNFLIMLDNSASMGWSSDSTFYPVDVDVDSEGNVYSVEYHHHTIKKYDSSGKLINTIVSPITGNKAFLYPTKIAIDSNDNIFVLNKSYGGSIISYDSSGNFRCMGDIGGPWDHYPRIYDDIDVDSTGRVYVLADWAQSAFYFDNNCIKSTSSFLRYGTNRPRFTGRMSVGYGFPGPLAIDENDNALTWGRSSQYFNKWSNKRQHGYLEFAYVTDGWSNNGTASHSTVTDIETAQNNNYIMSFSENKIYCYNSLLQPHTSWAGSGDPRYPGRFGGYGTSPTQWRYSYGFSAKGSDIYVADYYGHRILKLDATNCSGTHLATFGGSEDRMTIAKRVIKKIVSNSGLTSGANFGLMEWGSSDKTEVRVKISDKGAKQIFSDIDNVKAESSHTHLGQAMQKAHNYYKGPDSPIDKKKADCQNNYVIVISDGDWYGSPDPDAVAETMLDANGVKTFVLGFQGYSSILPYANLAKAGGTTTPLFADDETELLQKLTDAIQQAVLTSELTFTAPAIMPDVEFGDHIFQAKFNYKDNAQWEGRLVKYALGANGNIGKQVWDAGEELNKTKAASRNIWSAGLNYPSGTNNFTTSNLAHLKGDLYFGTSAETDTNANKLINFIRGIDSYDEDSDGSITDERWKLADIYHSQISVVGPPSAPVGSANSYTESFYRNANQYQDFIASNQNRKQIILAGSNGGMLHAFSSSTGVELWAFIPPSLLPKLRNVVSSKSNSSNSIYGVDGSPVVKDIYYDNKWRTVVLTGLRQGGHSYFALDITDIDNPTHLFTFDNDPSSQTISYWDSSGYKTEYSYISSIPSEYDFSKLGESWSTPRILRIKVSNKDKWVAVFGAGFNNGVNTNYGSSVFVIDMEDDGKVLQRVDVADKSGNSVVNSVPASVIPIIADGSSLANYYGAIAYFADYEGKLWKLNLSDKGTLYAIQQLFDAESTDTNGRRVMKDVVASIDTNDMLWIYYGTGDQQQLQKVSPSIANKLYGLKDTDFPNYNSSASTFSVDQCRNVTSRSASCPSDNEKGWYINLKDNEKTTSKATVSNRTVYFSRYIPNDTNPCVPGNASITSLESRCGNVEQDISLGGGVATEVVIFNDKIYVGLSGAPASTGSPSSGTSTSDTTTLEEGWTKTGNLIVGTVPADPPGSGIGQQITIESWREIF